MASLSEDYRLVQSVTPENLTRLGRQTANLTQNGADEQLAVHHRRRRQHIIE
jgi:hypothetical protein